MTVKVPWLRRMQRRRLRAVLRGASRLSKSGQLGRIPSLKALLTSTPITACEGRASRLLFGAAYDDAERVVRQYLLVRMAGQSLNNALLYALGTPGSVVAHPLPIEWRRVLRSQGFRVAERRSQLLFAGFLLAMLGYGILSNLRRVIENVLALVRPALKPAGPFVYFDGMSPGTLPQPAPDGRSHDFVTWYTRWEGRARDVEALCHGVTSVKPRTVYGMALIPVSSVTLPLTGISSMARLLIYSIWAAALAAYDLTRGRWWHALMLSEAGLAMQLRLQRADRVAQDYLLHNSRLTFRPLWTYEAEARGARVILYFYSTNSEGFRPAVGDTQPGYGWRSMNWPHYLVWDDGLAGFVRRAVGPDARISIVGPIWFTSSPELMPAFGGRTIGVFDVTPFRRSIYLTAGPDREFYVPKTSIAFLSDTLHVARENGYSLVWKRKRKIGALAHARYRRFAEELESAEGVAAISPDISAVRVIEACDMVISMPFTSTALIARHFKKPSCYYDPRALLRADDRAAHGLPIIQSREALAAWVAHHASRRASA